MLFRPLPVLLCALLLHGCSDDGGFTNHDATAPPPKDQGPPPDGPAADWLIQADGTVGPPVALSLATFNVKDFFDAQDDPTHFDLVLTASEVKSKIVELGQALRQLKADVIALQEVENKPLLLRLVNEELSTLGYTNVVLIEGNDARGIDVALLSRYPVTKARSHVGDRFKGVDGDTTTYGFSRDCLEATLALGPGRELILLVNHLAATDSENYQESINRRKAQASRVREILDGILAAHPQANLAVVGDLNDTPDSRTLELVRDGSPSLFDVLTLVPSSERYTHAKKSQLDYILLGPGLKADLTESSVKADHSQVFSDTSDHVPVFARFTVK